MKRLIVSLLAAYSTLAVADTMFCAIDGYNNEYGCSWYNLASCRQFIAMVPGGACVMRESKPTTQDSRSTEPPAARRIQPQQSLEESRRKSNQKLLPLAPPDSYLTPETEAIILSALVGALELDPENSTRNWQNAARGSSGTVTVLAIRKNQFDDPCRSFVVTMKWRSLEQRLLNGTACRHDGKWNWIE